MRVLLVDDERFFRELYTGYLDREPELEVASFETAEEALEDFERTGADAVVTDLVMPGFDGLGLIAALRERDPDLPVVVVTHREDARPAAEALRLGVNEYLLKPIERDVLVLAVRRSVEAMRLRRENRRLEAQHALHLRSEHVYRACLDLLGDLDVDRVQERILATLASLTGAQGAALWSSTGDEGDFVLRGQLGLIGEVPSRIDLDTRTTLARRMRAQAPYVVEGRALFVPLVADGHLVGVAMASDKVSGDFDPSDVSLARTVGDFAAVALRNAVRVSGLQRVGLRDRETSAYNITYFIDYAGKEIYKARRYARTFSLVAIQVDNLAVLRRTLPEEVTKTVHRALIAAVQRVIRDSDVLAKVTDDTFYVLLPETDYFGSLMFARRATAAFAGSPVVAELSVPPSISMGAATYPKDGDDFDELLVQCRLRQDAVRASPYRRLHLSDQPFWDLVDKLLQTRARSALTGAGGRRGELPEGLLEVLLRTAARELQRDPTARGLLYFGQREIAPGLPLLGELDPTREGSARIYLLGRQVSGALDHPSVTAVPLPDEARLEQHRFFLFLTEHASYAWVEALGGGVTFHTSDSTLVEALVARLQEAYDLQRQF